ncbi:MAG: hypothetical protein GX300_06060 [Tissierellia bacterium]|jgi:hypothetical protein|nr:hypothetical protein [Tissierellia bacterium]
MKTKITSNVLEDLSRRLKGDSSSVSGEGVVVVFNGSNIRLDKKLEYIKSLKQRGMMISLAFSFMAEGIIDTKRIVDYLNPYKVYKEADIFNLQDIVRENSTLIGPNITTNTLSKVALGMIDSFVPSLIWTFLYKNKKVYLDFSSVKQYLGEETQNKGILDLINGHVKTLEKMGAIEINENNFKQVYLDGVQIPIVDSDRKVEGIKKVLTEKDILSISAKSNLILPRGTILTPLAKDKSKEKNITIQFK